MWSYTIEGIIVIVTVNPPSCMISKTCLSYFSSLLQLQNFIDKTFMVQCVFCIFLCRTFATLKKLYNYAKY